MIRQRHLGRGRALYVVDLVDLVELVGAGEEREQAHNLQ